MSATRLALVGLIAGNLAACGGGPPFQERRPPQIDIFMKSAARQNLQMIGGERTSTREWPFMVAFRRPAGLASEHLCGGSLISPQWVLTAAHCGVAPGDVAVLGRTDLTRSSEGVERVIVARAVSHEDYNATTLENDIALVSIPTVPGFSPIRGASLPARTTALFGLGWGRTAEFGAPSPTLMVAGMRIFSQATCRVNYATRAARRMQVRDTMFCANGPGRDACKGDSGGPLVAGRGTSAVLVGIVSFGDGCLQPDFPGVYTRVGSFTSWIQEKTGVSMD